MPEKNPQILSERPPVIVIMGHIDHGKSTLLDYIRKTNTVLKEAGGITQHIAAYEVIHKNKEGKQSKITFLDTPGHEAFSRIRARGAKVADIAVLVVSAEDGVKPQTVEALKAIEKEKLPYIVAINKIDKPGANIEKTKQSLAEHGIYIEGYGGTIPSVPISAKTGEGVPELLDMMLLVAELEELKGDTSKNAEGVVIEAGRDQKKGIFATLIITDGTLKKGAHVVAGESFAPVRIMEDFAGKLIDEATLSSPVKIIGFNMVPEVGASFEIVKTKKEAEKMIELAKESKTAEVKSVETLKEGTVTIPLIVKGDALGSIEGIEHEIEKLKNETIILKIISSGIGNISESDLKLASGATGGIILGFHIKIEAQAESLRERLGLEVKIFDVIYELVDYLKTVIAEKKPKVFADEVFGTAKILKVFSKSKDREIIGGKVESGSLKTGAQFKIMRRDNEIGRGYIKELQQQKAKTSEVKEGFEFGASVETKMEIAPGDRIECIETKEQK